MRAAEAGNSLGLILDVMTREIAFQWIEDSVATTKQNVSCIMCQPNIKHRHIKKETICPI